MGDLGTPPIDPASLSRQGPTQSREIAARRNIPEAYLHQVLGALNRAGLVRSTRGPLGARTNTGPHYATTAHGPDLYPAAQQAVRYMIEHLVEERGLSPEEAYILCSVAVDLRISEIVDAPNWIVSAFLPESIFL